MHLQYSDSKLQVGPLPLSDSTQLVPLQFCHNSGRNSIINYMPPFQEIAFWAAEVGDSIADITKELLKAVS